MCISRFNPIWKFISGKYANASPSVIPRPVATVKVASDCDWTESIASVVALYESGILLKLKLFLDVLLEVPVVTFPIKFQAAAIGLSSLRGYLISSIENDEIISRAYFVHIDFPSESLVSLYVRSRKNPVEMDVLVK